MAVGIVQRFQSSVFQSGNDSRQVRSISSADARNRSMPVRHRSSHLGPLALEPPPAFLERPVVARAEPLRLGLVMLFDPAEQRGILRLDLLEGPVAPGDQVGQPFGIGALGPLQVDLLAFFDIRQGGGVGFVGLIGLGLVAGDDLGIQPLALGLGRFEHGRVPQSGFQQGLPQGQIALDGMPLGDVVGPGAGHDAHHGGNAAADGRPPPVVPTADGDDKRRIGHDGPNEPRISRAVVTPWNSRGRTCLARLRD